MWNFPRRLGTCDPTGEHRNWKDWFEFWTYSVDVQERYKVDKCEVTSLDMCSAGIYEVAFPCRWSICA